MNLNGRVNRLEKGNPEPSEIVLSDKELRDRICGFVTACAVKVMDKKPLSKYEVDLLQKLMPSPDFPKHLLPYLELEAPKEA